MEKKSPTAIYAFFVNSTAPSSGGYLYNHFKRGGLGIKRPGPKNPYADAAWRAGRDVAAKKS